MNGGYHDADDKSHERRSLLLHQLPLVPQGQHDELGWMDQVKREQICK